MRHAVCCRVETGYLKHPVAWKKDSASLSVRSEPVVYGRITRSIKAGRALFSRSGFRLSEEDKFHSRPGKKRNQILTLSLSLSSYVILRNQKKMLVMFSTGQKLRGNDWQQDLNRMI